MPILISILLIVEVVAAFLLIVVILAQKSKDQGLGMAFGGGMGESLFGSRAGNVLTRMTVGLAVTFMVTTMLLAILFSRGSTAGGSVMDRADAETPAASALPTQTAPAELPSASDLPLDVPMDQASAPVVMQMDDSGDLTPVDAASVEEIAVDEMPEPVVSETVDAPAVEDAPAAAEEPAPSEASPAQD